MHRILVIDDEDQMRSLLRMALEDRGYEVVDAPNGQAGLEIVRTHVPALVLCDVNMGKLDGYATLARIRQDPATVSVPFILMTGMADNAGMRQGMELGADDYLPKPFTIPQLYAAVETRLKKADAMRVEAERKLDDLRANISMVLPHELRTPLNGILSFGELLANSADTLEKWEVAEMGRDIHESAHKLERLVENALIFTQLQLLGTDVGPGDSWGETPEAMSVVETAARPLADRYGRSEDLLLALNSLTVKISGENLAKIVSELVDNAFKFSQTGQRVFVSLDYEGGTAVLLVHDEGRGMTSGQITSIGAYLQFDRQRYQQEGLGLGLTIAKRLVQLHGGSLNISSQEGTTVTVRLPVG